MDLVQNLRPEHLQSFWYSASKYCFALVGAFISLLWVTALDTDEAKIYKAKLHEYQWLLRLSSKSADFIERAISMLATSTGILVKGIPDRPDVKAILNRRKPFTAAPGPVHSDQMRSTPQMSAVHEHPATEYNDDMNVDPIAGEATLLDGDGWVGEQLRPESADFNN
jgi:hypothetical protein